MGAGVQPASAATEAEVLEANIRAMQVAYACRHTSDAMYRATYKAAKRAAVRYSFEIPGAERRVFELHKALQDGTVAPPKISKAKCEGAVEDAIDEAMLLQREL